MARQAEYRRSDAQLYGAFKYPTLSNESAVILANTLDDCLYRGLAVLDVTDYVRRVYGKLVVEAIFRRKQKSLSTDNDRYYLTTLPGMHRDDWLIAVRKHVSPIREIWINTLNHFIKTNLNMLSLGRASDVHAAEIMTRVESKYDCPPGALYGVIAEAQYQMTRAQGIVDRMSRPYLRRVVSLAKTYANEPEAFLENYQSGFQGVLTAIGKYDGRFGAFAFLVDIWVRNRMIAGITKSSNSFTLPDRVWKHKRLLDKHSNKDVEEIAALEGVSADLLRDSAHLLDVRNASQIIEESDEDNEIFEAYHDKQAAEEEDDTLVIEQVRLLASKLSAAHRLVLSLAFDVDLHKDNVKPEDIRVETARQLFCTILG